MKTLHNVTRITVKSCGSTADRPTTWWSWTGSSGRFLSSYNHTPRKNPRSTRRTSWTSRWRCWDQHGIFNATQSIVKYAASFSYRNAAQFECRHSLRKHWQHYEDVPNHRNSGCRSNSAVCIGWARRAFLILARALGEMMNISIS